jgi:hypothetical protein
VADGYYFAEQSFMGKPKIEGSAGGGKTGGEVPWRQVMSSDAATGLTEVCQPRGTRVWQPNHPALAPARNTAFDSHARISWGGENREAHENLMG